MTLLDLLKKANQGYPDGFLAAYYNARTGEPKPGSGDTLAQFVVVELKGTFDPEATDERQIEEAVRALERARADLFGTIAALEGEGLSAGRDGRGF